MSNIYLQLDNLEPGQVSYFSVNNRDYALVSRPEENPSAAGPEVNDSGRYPAAAGPVGGRYQNRRLALRAQADLPPGYEIEPAGSGFQLYFNAKLVAWAPRVEDLHAAIEHLTGRPKDPTWK